MQKAYLVLENGTVFEGTSFGATGTTIGELVFTTSMVGYNDLLTDASYYGQVVMNTFPLIGNYGIVFEDYKHKKPYINGYIVREKCDNPSNFNCKCTLEEYMNIHNIIGICDVDTRKLTKILRDNGTMNCMITDSKDNIDIDKIKSYKICDAVKNVSYSVENVVDNGSFNVVVYNFGSLNNITDELSKRGCKVNVVNYDTDITDICADGVILSDGPGNPEDIINISENIKKIMEKNIPVFGISLGHQILAIANGCKTIKLKYGHRGSSQPVKDINKGTVCITSQNHGYAVDPASVPADAKISFANVNDGTIEGIEYTNKKAFSVQFHPVSSGGPHDTDYLFDKFIDMMKEVK